MPSVSLQSWRVDRILSLQEVDRQCADSLALAPPNPRLYEENLRGFIMLLSAHFQGFCRDLYTECSQIVAGAMPLPLQVMIQTQFTTNLALDRGNPNRDNIRKDFDRFGIPLDLVAIDPANHGRLRELERLNRWRNVAAHHGVVPPGGLPSLADLRGWQDSFDGLATCLDGILYNQPRIALGVEPWAP
jgi:hypothetical protein